MRLASKAPGARSAPDEFLSIYSAFLHLISDFQFHPKSFKFILSVFIQRPNSYPNNRRRLSDGAPPAFFVRYSRIAAANATMPSPV
jgi:hypothetical protein